MVWQVALFEAAPEGAAVPGTELHQVALAHIAAGLQLQSPPHIRTADKMLSFMASSCRCGSAADCQPSALLPRGWQQELLALWAHPAAACRPEDRDDIDIAIAVCKLLQGEAQAAEALLGFGPSATKAPDPDIQIFLLVSPLVSFVVEPT